MLWTIRLHKNHVSADKAGIYVHFLQAKTKSLRNLEYVKKYLLNFIWQTSVAFWANSAALNPVLFRIKNKKYSSL